LAKDGSGWRSSAGKNQEISWKCSQDWIACLRAHSTSFLCVFIRICLNVFKVYPRFSPHSLHWMLLIFYAYAHNNNGRPTTGKQKVSTLCKYIYTCIYVPWIRIQLPKTHTLNLVTSAWHLKLLLPLLKSNFDPAEPMREPWVSSNNPHPWPVLRPLDRRTVAWGK